MSDSSDPLGLQLRDLRQAKDMTLGDMARRSGNQLTPGVLSRVERLNTNPGLDLLERIADAYDCRIVIDPERTYVEDCPRTG